MRRLAVRSLYFLSLIGLAAIPQAANAALSITSPPSGPTFPIGVIQMPLQATGGTAPYLFTLAPGSASLPPGFAIRSDVPSFFPGGVTQGIIGVATTPTGGSPYQFTLQVTDSTSATATLAVTMTVTGENFKDLNNLPDALVNSSTPYSYTFTVLNGTAPSVSLGTQNPSGCLAGLTLTGTTLSGTPTVATPGNSTCNFQLQISDGGTSVSENFNLRIATLAITTAGILPNATQNTSYNGGSGVTLASTGGAGGYTYQIVNGGLPQGLNLSGAVISGTVCTCTGTGRYTMSIKVTDTSSNSYQQNFSMDVLGTVAVLPTLPTFALSDVTVGVPASFSFGASGGVAPYVWSVAGLPTGMSFRSGAGTSSNVNPGDVELWGVPQSVGPFNVTVTATDSNGIGVSATVPLHVSALAYGFQGANSNALGTINTAISPAYQLRVIGGTGNYTPALTNGAIPSGTVLSFSPSPTGGNITGTPYENGNFNFQVAFNDSASGTPNTLTVNLNLNVSPNVVQIFNSANLGVYPTGGSNTVNLTFNGCCAQSGSLTWTVPNTGVYTGNTLPSGLGLSTSGQLTGAVASATDAQFFVEAADGSNNTAVKQFTIHFSPITITTNNLTYGNVGTMYPAVQFIATGLQGTPVNWSISNGFLPPGMQLTSGGLLGNTPTSPGRYNFQVAVIDGLGHTANRGYTLDIYPAGSGPPVSVGGGSLGTYTKGDVEADLFASGGNGSFTWSLQSGTLPSGLTIRTDNQFNTGSASAALIGVATTPGNYSFTLMASSAGQSAMAAFTMKITALNLVDGFTLPDAYGGVAYNYTLTPINNAGTVTYTLSTTNNNPPSWLSINPTTGLLSGTPVAPFNQFSFNVTINDGTDTVSRFFNLNTHAIQITCASINPCPNGQMPNATQGQTYTLSLAATDTGGVVAGFRPADLKPLAGGTGTGTASVTYTANNLPNGLTIQNGVITGTVNSNAFTGLQSVTINANDGTNTTSQQFSIVVNGTAAQLPRLNLGNIGDPTLGQPYSTTIPVCCGGVGTSFTWTVAGLPAGLFYRYAGSGTAGAASGTPSTNVTPGVLEIYGIPQSVGSSTVNVTVSDSSATPQTTGLSFNMHVSALDQTVNLPNPTFGQAYGWVLREIGGTTGYTVSLVGGALPAGLSLVSTTANGINTARIQGVPTESGNFNFKLHFVDSTSGTANTLDRYFGFNVASSTDNINLQINATSPLQSLVTGTTNVNIGLGACCTNATPYTWSIVGGALPASLNLNSSSGTNGSITGTASPAGNYTFLVQVQDGNGNTARRQLALQISSLQITTNSLPFGNVTSQYNGGSGGFALTATGGTGALTWSLQSGTFLPPGLTLTNGAIVGTPTSTGQYFPTLVVTDSAVPANSTSISLVLNVYPAGGGPPLAIQTNANLGTWSVGEYQIQFVASGGTGAYVWSQTGGTLPPGYALRTDLPSYFSSNASAGLIGVGTAPGTYNFTLQVTSGSQMVSEAFSIVITNLTVKDPYMPDAFVGQTYNGSASGYTMTALNPAAAGDTVTFAATPATCSVSFPTNCVPPGLTISSSGQITGTPTAGSAGAYTFNLAVSDATGAGTVTINRQFTINTYAIQITSNGVLPNATQGQAYSAPALTQTGVTGTATWTSNGLPGGFVLNSATGVISAPSSFSAGPNRYGVTVTVTDSNGSVSSVKRFALDVVGVPFTLPQVNFGQTDDLTLGQTYSIDINTSGGGIGPFTYTATGLPAGMSIRPAIIGENNNGLVSGDGQIWGTPTALGNFNVVVNATDSSTPNFSVSNSFALHVVPLVHDSSLPQGMIGVSYNSGLRILGGTGPYSLVQSLAGFLPDGLTRTGLNVSGTPLESGGFSVTYKYSDSATPANTLIRTDFFNINNASALQINNGGNLGTVTVNQSYTNNLNVTGCCGSDPLTWSVVSGNNSLPPGITLTSAGVLGGTPTAAQTQPYTFLVEVQDTITTTNTAFRQFTMLVTPISLTSNTNLNFGNLNTAGYSTTLTTTESGSPVTLTWALGQGSNLPPGLILSGNTISGTPTSTGQYFFNLTGTDAATGYMIVRGFTINIYVAGGGPPLSLTNLGPNFNFSIGVQTPQLAASGGTPPYTYSWTPSATPVPGCRVQTGGPMPTNFPSGVTSGILCLLTTPTTYNTSVRVTDSASTPATFDRPITFNVLPILLGMQGQLPKATVGVSYSYDPGASGGVAATGGTTYTFSATNLPSGLSINSASGVITGTPTTAGTFNPTITLGAASVSGTLNFGVTMVVNPFAIANTTILPQGTAGSVYSQTLTASGCGTGCIWSAPNGGLPGNFSLTTVSGNGSLSTGTATASTFNGSFTIQATGSNGTTQEIFSVIIAPSAITALSVSTNIISTSQLGASANVGLFANGGVPPYTYSVSAGSLPTGVTIQSPGDQINGNLAPGIPYLAGRPSVAGTYNFTIQVTDSTVGTHLTATKPLTWTISPMAILYNNLPLTASGLIVNQASTPQPILVVGGSGTYTSWTNPVATQQLPSGLTLNSSTGVITGSPTTTGNVSVPFLITDNTTPTANFVNSNINFNVTSNSSGAEVTLGGPAYGTVVPLGSTQTYSLNPSGGTGPYTISAIGSLPAGVLLESGNMLGSSFGAGSNGMQVIFSTPGTYTFTLQAMDSSTPALVGGRAYSLIVPGYGPLQTSTTLPQGSIGVAYSQQLYAFDDTTTVTWALAPGSALPPGLGVSGAGVISGTPTATGTYSFVLNFGDTAGTSSNTFTLKISAVAITTVTSTPGVLPLATINIPYGTGGAGVTLTSTGGSGSTTWTLIGGTMPNGLSLSGSTGVISGTPTGNNGTGLFVITVAATNTGGSINRQYSIFVSQTNPGVLDFTPYQTALNDATLGQFVSYVLVPDGGVPGYTWTVPSGSTLPPGLSLVPATSLNSSGPGIMTLAGIPYVPGPYSFNLLLTDSTGAANAVTRTFTLNVSPISITTNNPPNSKQATPYQFQFEATGGTAPYTYTLIANPSNSFGQDALPFGLSMNGSGLISGTPTGTGSFNFLLTVTDSAMHTLTKPLTITSLNSLNAQITLKNAYLVVNEYINQQLAVSGVSSSFNWSTVAVTPTPAAPIVAGLPPGIMLQSNGTLSGSATTPGTYRFAVQAVDNSNGSDIILRTITVNVTPISLTSPVTNGLFSPSFPAATVGASYSFPLVAAGGMPPYTFAETPTYPLPLGMTLSSTGVISGMPTQSGRYTIRPIITDANGVQAFYSTVTLIVTTNGKPPLNPRSNINVSDASVGIPYALPLDRLLDGGVAPFTWTLANGSTLPPGVSILAGSAGGSNILAGTPTVAGIYNFTLNIADSSGQTLVFPAQGFAVSPLSIAPGSIPNAVRGTSYSASLAVTGGTPPYSYQYEPGWTPPPGMSISGGLLSGTPTYAGVFPFGILVTDSAGTPNTLNYYYDFSVDDAAGEVPSEAVGPVPVTILFTLGSATTSTPITISSSSGHLPFNASLYGLPGTTLSTASGTTNGSVNIGFGALGAGTYSGFLGASVPGAVNAVVFDPVSITVLSPPPCTYTLSTNSTSSPIVGDSGVINISAGPGCAWTAAVTSNPGSMINPLTGTTSGSGNGTVPYSTSDNTGNPARSGAITITGQVTGGGTTTQTFTINQFGTSCTFSINPSVISATAAGGSATVNVVASGSACGWTASGLSASPASGTGTGSFMVTIPSTVNAAQPTATVSSSGSGYAAPESQTFTVNQSALSCVTTLSAGTALFAATGGSGLVNVTVPAGCPYNTVLGPSWINVTSGGSTLSAPGGPVALTYTVDPNSTTLSRSGALTIGGQTYGITEQALACSVSLDTSTLGSPFAAAGGAGTIGVTTNGSNCSWNASSNSAFATATPATGFGNGTVMVTASSNTNSTTSRNGSVSISGQNISFTQAGTTCSYSLLSNSVAMPATAGLATISVVAPSACMWTATPATNPGNFLAVIASGTGGTADVSFTATANASAIPRVGTLTVAGLTFTVNQAGAPCSYALVSSSANPGGPASSSGLLANTASAGLTVTYTASSSGCTPVVQSFSSWITAANSFSGQNGTMTYSVAANASGATRTGNVQIGDQVFVVTQAGTGCTFSLNSYGISVNYIGATGSILGSANLGTCLNPGDASTQPFVQVTGVTGTPQQYTLPFTVSPFVSSTNTVRVGQITFGGLLFSVKQTSY